MPTEETPLRALARETLGTLATWRDDVKVRLHLAGMDARDAWKEVEPKVERVEASLRKVLDTVVPGGAEEVRLEIALGAAEARDRLAALESKLEEVGHDLARSGREALNKLTTDPRVKR